jgi:hypothetical protein
MNLRTYPPPQWRIRDLIDGLRPYSRISKRLEERGYPRLPLSTIAAWRTQDSIPGVWMPAMLDLGLEDRIIVNIEDFRVSPI